MKSNWTNPIGSGQVIALAGSENTPFLWHGALYRLENFKRCEDFPGQPATFRFHEDGFRIIEDATGRVVSIPLLNHYFATATVHEGRVWVFCGDYELDRPWWEIRHMVMISSDDLISWSKPQLVLEANADEHIFNNAVLFDGNRWVMLYESDDPRYPKFTFKFAVSEDLRHWRKLPEALYGTDKYVGGPAMYFEAPYYYITYTGDTGHGMWDTRIARSTDLKHWTDAPADRPMLTPDPTHLTNPEHFPGVYERNASDLELIECDGKVICWWNGGDQMSCGDLKRGEFIGTRRELLETFFDGMA